MTSKKPTPPRSIGRLLNFATGRMNALCQRLLEPHDLSLPQWVILSCLWREGPLTVGALAELIGTGLPATSRIIDRMAERGLVQRRRDATDRRLIVVTVTDRGLELNHLADFYEQINSVLLDGFDERERKLIFEFLLRVRRNAERALE